MTKKKICKNCIWFNSNPAPYGGCDYFYDYAAENNTCEHFEETTTNRNHFYECLVTRKKVYILEYKINGEWFEAGKYYSEVLDADDNDSIQALIMKAFKCGREATDAIEDIRIKVMKAEGVNKECTEVVSRLESETPTLHIDYYLMSTNNSIGCP